MSSQNGPKCSVWETWRSRNVATTDSQRALSQVAVRSGVVTETTRSEAVKTQRTLVSKVPEVTVWFWVIKILSTTVVRASPTGST